MLGEDELAAQHAAIMVAFITYMVLCSDCKSEHYIVASFIKVSNLGDLLNFFLSFFKTMNP